MKPQHAQPWGGWATTAEDPTGYHSSPLQIGKRGCNLQELTKIGQLKTGKMLPGLMSLDFCWELRHSDGRVRIGRKKNENMESIVSDHVHPFMTTRLQHVTPQTFKFQSVETRSDRRQHRQGKHTDQQNTMKSVVVCRCSVNWFEIKYDGKI